MISIHDYTGCPHKKYTEIKINIMAKLLHMGKISQERAECPLCNGTCIQLVMLLTQMSEQIRQMLTPSLRRPYTCMQFYFRPPVGQRVNTHSVF